MRRLDKVDAVHIDDLISRYTCGEAVCPNQNLYCLVVDNVHLKMLPKQLKVWSIAINDEDATLEDCPPELIRTLMPARSSQKNPLRNPPPKNVEKAPDSSVPIHPTPHPGHLHQPFTPLSYYPYPPPYHPPTYRQYPERSPPTPLCHRTELQAS